MSPEDPRQLWRLGSRADGGRRAGSPGRQARTQAADPLCVPSAEAAAGETPDDNREHEHDFVICYDELHKTNNKNEGTPGTGP